MIERLQNQGFAPGVLLQPVIATGEVEDVIVPETTMSATQAIYDMTRGLTCAHFGGIDFVAVDGHVYQAAALRPDLVSDKTVGELSTGEPLKRGSGLYQAPVRISARS